ncbi:MAG: AEC family transporter [Pseudomonadota bacterium]
MELFLDILLKVTLPIIALVGIGWITQRWLTLDVASLNRLLVFVTMPCFLVHYLSTATQPIGEVWPTIYFTVIQFSALMLLGLVAAVAFRLPRSYWPVVAMATVYANVGNFGIPMVSLAFPAEFIVHQSVITSLMTILIVSVGQWLLAPSTAATGFLARIKGAFETPVVPAVALGLGLRALEVRLPPILAIPVEMTGSIFAPLALLALGAQLAAGSRGVVRAVPLSVVLVLKLVAAPLLTWGLAIVLAMPDDLTDLLVVAAATPVGVLLAVFCVEFDRHPRFVASAILVSTLLSPLVVAAWILMMRLS